MGDYIKVYIATVLTSMSCQLNILLTMKRTKNELMPRRGTAHNGCYKEDVYISTKTIFSKSSGLRGDAPFIGSTDSGE